jgi:hypothetical protein
VPSRHASSRYLAFGLPGGRATAIEPSERTLWPLGALVRIVREPVAVHTELTCLRGTDALFAVREAVEMPELGAGMKASELGQLESQCLSHIAACATHVPVGALRTVLGQDPSELLRELLNTGGGA